MLLERGIQPAGVLAGVSGVLVDSGVLDNEEADTEYDQVQVSLLEEVKRIKNTC